MTLEEWNARYRAAEGGAGEPARLVVEIAKGLKPGRALDLACGTGRNAVWLEREGWDVTAVDGAEAAVERVRAASGVTAVVADLESGEYRVEPGAWDLILSCYYFHRPLVAQMKAGVRPGGVAVVIAHLNDPGEPVHARRAEAGELAGMFADWEVMHSYEGPPRDMEHKRAVAEIAARRVA